MARRRQFLSDHKYGGAIVENANDFFSAWMKAQNQAFELLRKQAEQVRSFYQGEASHENPFEAWCKLALDAVVAGGDAEMVRETLHKAFGSSGAYQKLFDLWQPVLKAVHERNLDPAAWKELLDPAKIKEVVDKLFNLDDAGAANLQAQMAQFSELLNSHSEHFGKPWLDAAMQNMQSFPQFVQGHPEVLMQIFHRLFNAFDATVGRSFHVPAVGKDREKMELMSRCIDDMSVYAAKNVEYQHAMYLTGIEAMEKVMSELALKIESGEEISKFDDFFDLWIDINEKTYYELFQTTAFAKLKGELLDAGLNARKHYFKLMEMSLFDLPIALRSEMDDLYKTIYELRKAVKKLQAQMKEVA
jgi:class III poly(R)-hydroxyalkanoic acid synthase PhaE subunit